jgi:hypothetical protein
LGIPFIKKFKCAAFHEILKERERERERERDNANRGNSVVIFNKFNIIFCYAYFLKHLP